MSGKRFSIGRFLFFAVPIVLLAALPGAARDGVRTFLAGVGIWFVAVKLAEREVPSDPPTRRGVDGGVR